jgi:hypothetical protein
MTISAQCAGEPFEPDEPDGSGEPIQPNESIGPGKPEILRDLTEVLHSKYCPECGMPYHLRETRCPLDGATLRDLSITTYLDTGSVMPGKLTPDTLIDALDDLINQHPDAGEMPPTDPLLLGKVLGGKWKVEKLVGKGGFGTFYLGRHVTLGMQVGIKVLRKRFTGNGAGLHSFHKEAMRSSLLHHPGIVKVFDYGNEEDQPYLVMEYLTGTPLHRYFGDKSFSVRDGVEVIRQTAEALGAAHRGEGVGEPLVHLDVKPEHIFIEKFQERWHVKMIDFGIAEIAAATDSLNLQTERGRNRIAGTMPYMAPERWRGEVDPRCDLYSLGIILYELVAARKPFDAEDPRTMRRLHNYYKPKPPSLHRLGHREPGLKELDCIVLQLLEKDQNRRAQSAERLVEILESWQKRQERKPANRVAVPATMALLLAGLAGWSPWDGVTLTTPSTNPARVGAGPVPFAAVVRGVGYSTAFLRVQDGSRFKDIPLGEVQPNGMVAKSITRGDFPSDLPEGKPLQASIVASGWLGRKVRLHEDELKIILDSHAPKIVELNGSAAPEGEDNPLWVRPDTEGRIMLRIMADEPLDVGLCTLNGSLAESEGRTDETENRSARFELQKGAYIARFHLVDMAGNDVKLSWPVKVSSGIAPRLLSLADRWTNQDTTTVELEYGEDPGDVTVIVDDLSQPLSTRKETKTGIWRAAATVSFDPGVEGLQDKEIVVQNKPPGEVPSGEERFNVHYLRRDLAVTRVPDNDNSVPVLRAMTKDGEAIEEPLDWEVFVHWSGRENKTDFWFQRHQGLDKPLNTLDSLRGQYGIFELEARAIDRYGNQSPPQKFIFPHQIAAPRIDKLAIAPGQSILHHPGCGKADAQKRIIIEFIDSYDMGRNSLLLSLWLEKTTSLGVKEPIPVNFDVSDQQAEQLIVRADLLRKDTEVGPNQLTLRLEDTRTRIFDEQSCTLTMEAKPDVDIEPKDLDPISGSEVFLLVQPKGPRPKCIEVRSSRQEIRPSGANGRYPVPLKGFGSTEVEVQVTFEHGCQVTRNLHFKQTPQQGWTYGFEDRKRGVDFQLTCAGRLWHTNLKTDATADEAEKARRNLEQDLHVFLKQRSMVAGELTVRLASPDELSELGIRLAKGSRLWVQESRNDSSGSKKLQDALRVFHSSVTWTGVKFEKDRELLNWALGYVLVVEGLERIDKSLPGLARSCRKAEGGAK